MAQKVSAAMAEQAMKYILETLKKMNLKGYGQLLPPKVKAPKPMSLQRLQTMKAKTNRIHTVEIGWWTMFIIHLV